MLKIKEENILQKHKLQVWLSEPDDARVFCDYTFTSKLKSV